MEKRFSERIGAVSGRDVFQIGSMDQGLRNRLLNCLMRHGPSRRNGTTDRPSVSARLIWDGFLKLPLHQLSVKLLEDVFKSRFGIGAWHEVYDLIEFVCKECPAYTALPGNFNVVLEEEMAGYRFVGTTLTPITSEQEIAAVEGALSHDVDPVRDHIAKALELLSDRTSPDFENSMKESITAVEALLRDITGKKNATIGQAIKKLRPTTKYQTALIDSMEKVYTFTNSSGIRHAANEGDEKQERALASFMLVWCSAFISYMTELRSDGGVR